MLNRPSRSGRGNIFLESAVPLTKALQREIVALGQRLEALALLEEQGHGANGEPSKKPTRHHQRLSEAVADIKALLDRIDREIPLLQLAITASGESLSASLPASISPSRLLQASTLLTVGDTQFTQNPTRPVQIGPAFNLSLYMLFLGHSSPNVNGDSRGLSPKPVYGLGEHERKPLWQEVIHKARVRLCRSSPCHQHSTQAGGQLRCASLNSDELRQHLEYTYHLEIVEDLDDGRIHNGSDTATAYEDIPRAGIRELIPICQLSKIFYTDTGRILNIGNGPDGENNPVLLLKRDANATRGSGLSGVVDAMKTLGHGQADDDEGPCSENGEQEALDHQLEGEARSASLGERTTGAAEPSNLPAHLDQEWIALEVFEADDDGSARSDTEATSESESATEDGDSSDDEPRPRKQAGGRASLDSRFAAQIKNLSLQPSFGHSDARSSIQLPTDSPGAGSEDALDFVARSPFKAITTSLSLIEMLIRLAGLQEFQQASHLSIPDHVLTFFLEETSTTGLAGEARQSARNEAKRRVGFDPYTDIAAES